MTMEYDLAVIGGGHAGCEAALAAARLGVNTILFAINLDSIASMPCNPSIGGTSKGHLVREVDALGGEMGRNIDKTFIQSRMLNLGKGPAVHSLRAQADKGRYAREMKRVLEQTPHLTLRQSEIVDLAVENGRLAGVVTEYGDTVPLRAAVLCLGTYCQSRCLTGETITPCGPGGLRHARMISDSLRRLGVRLYRFKTGTPARVDRRSLDFSRMERQDGDRLIIPFSFETEARLIQREQIPCYLTYTNGQTHEVIRRNLHRSPLYAGVIEGTGTRYCPSIEDKVVRFADKERHQVFIEPEGEDTTEMYVQGMSSSLPQDVQTAMYHTVPGLENCRILRYAYAIEYDCIDATQLSPTLEFKDIPGLYSAGQFNGSSGYEEAAAQGIVAGLNAALGVLGRPPLLLRRDQAYIGVLIDDLVTKGTQEPYRMMTSRAEYRLLLRQDNADLRLTPLGYQAGLIAEERYQRLVAKREHIEQEIARVGRTVLSPGPALHSFLTERGSAALATGGSLSELIKRPELCYLSLAPFDAGRPALTDEEAEQVNIDVKYEGYIRRQRQQVEQFRRLEERALPPDLDYGQIPHLRLEARQKLAQLRPESLGRAARITGVSPADISVLAVYLETGKRLHREKTHQPGNGA